MEWFSAFWSWLVADTVLWWDRLAWSTIFLVFWVIIGPIRNVFMRCFWSVFKWVVDGLILGQACAERYLIIVKDPAVSELVGRAYAWSLLESFFLAPIEVLDERRTYYGEFGTACSLWCLSMQYTLCTFMPNSSERSWNGACGVKDHFCMAFGATVRRGFDLFVWLAITTQVIIGLAIFVPLACYSGVEYVCCGWGGVAVLLLSLVGLDYFWLSSSWCWTCVGIFMVLGVCEHAKRAYNDLDKVPKVGVTEVTQHGWSTLRRREHNRAIRERKIARTVEAAQQRNRVQQTTVDIEGGRQFEEEEPLHDGLRGVQAGLQRRPDGTSSELSALIGEHIVETEQNSLARRGRLAVGRGGCPGSASAARPWDDSSSVPPVGSVPPVEVIYTEYGGGRGGTVIREAPQPQ